MFRGRVIDYARSGRGAAVGNGHSHDGPMPGDFNGEGAAASARGMADGIAAQFVSHADHIVTRWARLGTAMPASAAGRGDGAPRR